MFAPLPLSRARRAAIGSAILVATAAIACLDYSSGIELRIYPLYFIPLSVAAWTLSRTSTVALALLCSAGWLVSNRAAGMSHEHAYVWVINFMSQAIAFVTVGLLVARLREAWAHEWQLSRRDPLTAVLNLRAFHEAAAEVLAQCRQAAAPISVAYIDVDDFKQVNDKAGHAAGDEVLRLLAASLQSSVRASDLVVRLGGDEFALLLPRTSEAAAAALLERMHERVAEAMKQAPMPVTVSVGAVWFASAPLDILEVVRKADAVMYASKAGGKARIVLASEPDPPSG